MAKCAVIWFRILVIFPFTLILTLVATVVTCSQVPNNFNSSRGQLPELSDLGTGQAHNYFMGGFIILLPQFLIMCIGRIHFLILSQTIVRPVIIFLIHSIIIACSIFLLIMAIVSLDDRRNLHLLGAIGTFSCIAIYCLLHTILIFYLFIHRSKAPEHSNVIFPIWFLIFTIISFISTIILAITNFSISQYCAVGSPFLYFLAFVPQFWIKAKQIEQVTKHICVENDSNTIKS
jgi:hypothetical protein